MKTKARVIKPLEMTSDSVITYMRNFQKSETYEVLMGLWGMQRDGIEEEGKRFLKPECWAKLDGFDQAAKTVAMWARKKTRAEREDGEQKSEDEE